MPKSFAPDVDIPVISLPEFIMSMSGLHAEKTALINGITGDSLTFNQFRTSATRLGSALIRRGIGKGTIVAVFCNNCPEFATVLVGILLTGATVSTVNIAFVPGEVTRQLDDSGATYLFASEALIHIAKEGVKGCNHIKELFIVGQSSGCTSLNNLLQDDGLALSQALPIDPINDVAIILYSSGTTGFPKGVLLTHYNLVTFFAQVSSPYFRGEVDMEEAPIQKVIVGVIPCYHAYGLIGVLIGGLIGGNKTVLLPRFKPDTFLSAIEKYKVTNMPLVPPLVNFLTKYPHLNRYNLSSIEGVNSGGAPLSADQEASFSKASKGERSIAQGYGLTETTICISTQPFDQQLRKPGSVGTPLPNTEIKISDVDTNEELGPNHRGEIWARGPQVMKGYHNRAEATNQVIDRDGWFHTGDIAYYDEDNTIYIVDRIKELIKYKGLQVAPAELEGILMNHPSIQDCGVTSVPDVYAGELPRAYVVKKPGAQLTAEDVMTFIQGQVAPYKYLRGGVEFVADIPKALSGKILRRVLKERAKKSKL